MRVLREPSPVASPRPTWPRLPEGPSERGPPEALEAKSTLGYRLLITVQLEEMERNKSEKDAQPSK